jgi:hypothetical protein
MHILQQKTKGGMHIIDKKTHAMSRTQKLPRHKATAQTSWDLEDLGCAMIFVVKQ